MRLSDEQIELLKQAAGTVGITIKSSDSGSVDAFRVLCDMAKEANAAKSVAGMPEFPAGIRKSIERACDDAEHPVGMSTHDNKARIPSSHVRNLLGHYDTLRAFATSKIAVAEGMAADAGRYRFLRERFNGDTWLEHSLAELVPYEVGPDAMISGNALDAAIDNAARSQGAEGGV